MVKSTEINADEACKEQLAAQPSQIPTHPDEKNNLPPPNIIPDGVSPPIQHPLDPLNAGKSIKRLYLTRKVIFLFPSNYAHIF